MKRNLQIQTLVLFLGVSLQLCANRLTYYRAPQWAGEPRITKDYLSSAIITASGGDTRFSYNQSGEIVDLFSRYGDENFRAIAQGVPTAILDQNSNHVLDDLANLSQPDFGKIRFSGDFKFSEINLKLIQNWKYNFFSELNIPFRKLRLSNLDYIDLSDPSQIGSASLNDWQNLTNNLISNLQKYNIHLGNYRCSTTGDISLELGWAESHTNTTHLDFWDTSIKFGLIFPTTNSNFRNPMVINPGYEGIIGFPFAFDIAAGLYEWITIGSRVAGVLFPEHSKIIGLKTDLNQTGLIRLASGPVCIEKGNIWEFSTYAKADHLAWGISATLAYHFTKQQSTHLVLPANSSFDCHIINTDQSLQGWKMHTINLSLECDFANDIAHHNYPQIYLNFDLPFTGHGCLKNKIFSGAIGLNLAW